MFATLGSLTRNVRRAITIAALLACSSTSQVAAVESSYNMRIHRGFLKRIADRNFNELLGHMEDNLIKELPTDKLSADLKEMRLRISPRGGQDWDAVETDLFFDQGQIVMEVNNLEYRGNAQVSDPRTGNQGDLEMHAPLEFCQIVLSLDQDVTDAGVLLPKLTVQEVVLQLHQSDFTVNVNGDLPVYRTSHFEKAIKDWIKNSVKARESDFKQGLQKAEREVMKSFALEKQTKFSKNAQSTLGEQMALKGDHLHLLWNTHYEGKDLAKVSKSMRSIQPAFSEIDIFQKDVQIAVDENFANYLLFSLFHREKPFSITETMLSMAPDSFVGAGAAIKAVMNTSLFGLVFPEIIEEHGKGKRLDLRCGLNKDYLHQGGLEDDSISQVFLHDGDRLEALLKFGCAVHVYGGESRENPLEALMDLFQQVNTEDDSGDWQLFRSFFVSATVDIEFEFGAHTKRMKHVGDHIIQLEGVDAPGRDQFVSGRIYDIKPKIHEIKLYRGDEQLKDEAGKVQDAIEKLYEQKDTLRENPVVAAALDMYFGNSMPLVPFPLIEQCLGVKGKNSDISIKEGYIQVAYEFDVDSANANCLFDIDNAVKYNMEAKQYRMGLEAQKRAGGRLSAKDEAMLSQMRQKAPVIKLFGERIDFSKGPSGLIDPIKNLATNPKVYLEVVQGLDKAKDGIAQAQKLFKKDGAIKEINNIFKGLFQN